MKKIQKNQNEDEDKERKRNTKLKPKVKTSDLVQCMWLSIKFVIKLILLLELNDC